MKKTIKKSQLKRLVESTLNELDWRTYASAAQKRNAQGNYQKAQSLADMAGERYTQQNPNVKQATFNSNMSSGQVRLKPSQPYNYQGKEYQDSTTHNFSTQNGKLNHNIYTQTNDSNGRMISQGGQPNAEYGQYSSQWGGGGHDNMGDFLNGQDTYVKGQGWKHKSRFGNVTPSDTLRENKNTDMDFSIKMAKSVIRSANRKFGTDLELKTGRNEDGYFVIATQVPGLGFFGSQDNETRQIVKYLEANGFKNYNGDGILEYEDDIVRKGWDKATERMETDDDNFQRTHRYDDHVVDKFTNEGYSRLVNQITESVIRRIVRK